MKKNEDVAREIVRDFGIEEDCDCLEGAECINGSYACYLKRRISEALTAARNEALKEAEKIVLDGYLYGDDCKNPDYACNRCGGDIRGKCCQWAYTYATNKDIAKAIAKLREVPQ